MDHDELFKVEDRGNGYRFVTAPDFPGFSAMLKPGEISWVSNHARTLILLAVLDERERCARIAEAIDSGRGNEKEIARAIRRASQ